jgi:hypothetical protein
MKTLNIYVEVTKEQYSALVSKAELYTDRARENDRNITFEPEDILALKVDRLLQDIDPDEF